FPGRGFPKPAAVAAMPAAKMRRAGFSRGKIRAIKDIARKARDGRVPTRRACHALADDALIEQLTELHGVGQWTVEMLLIFTLGRPDVLPVDDFGVREGFKILYRLDLAPKPKALVEIGLAWAPYRSTAAWYLWRASEEGKRAKQPSSRA